MKIKSEQLPRDAVATAEKLRADHTDPQTIFKRGTKALVLSYLNGPTENSVTIAADDAIGRRNKVRLTFDKNHRLIHAKTPREYGLSALGRYVIKRKRDAFKASQAEITTYLVRKAEEKIT